MWKYCDPWPENMNTVSDIAMLGFISSAAGQTATGMARSMGLNCWKAGSRRTIA
jgi:hypothetical protein